MTRLAVLAFAIFVALSILLYAIAKWDSYYFIADGLGISDRKPFLPEQLRSYKMIVDSLVDNCSSSLPKARVAYPRAHPNAELFDLFSPSPVEYGWILSELLIDLKTKAIAKERILGYLTANFLLDDKRNRYLFVVLEVINHPAFTPDERREVLIDLLSDTGQIWELECDSKKFAMRICDVALIQAWLSYNPVGGLYNLQIDDLEHCEKNYLTEDFFADLNWLAKYCILPLPGKQVILDNTKQFLVAQRAISPGRNPTFDSDGKMPHSDR